MILCVCVCIAFLPLQCTDQLIDLLIDCTKVDARNSINGEIVFKDNFSQAIAGIVEVTCCFVAFLLLICARLAGLVVGMTKC